MKCRWDTRKYDKKFKISSSLLIGSSFLLVVF